ncbi:hypothetical protein KUCAC02_027914 [Chaenocephalus aceratus]|uniref:Uncharacterized protein n=1 Tax=Chaenocephalus aceratus TaxID=36190 RepID=A0ACB9X0F9_CHAAC|nr:hypothetical protein KUCAC02_027914 [Chaenocephalus aceratus]
MQAAARGNGRTIELPSVHQFALEILRKNSTQRLATSAMAGPPHYPNPQQRKGRKLSSRSSETLQGQRTNPLTSSPPEQATSSSSHRSLLKDLIGDTSILDDLLKPKPKGVKQSPKTAPALAHVSVGPCLTTPSPSKITLNTDSGAVIDSLSSPNKPPTHQVVSKGCRKDFWDILNEGNEESINRLTDPAEVQRDCINTRIAARGRSGKEERESLWKTNDKFLWKNDARETISYILYFCSFEEDT